MAVFTLRANPPTRNTARACLDFCGVYAQCSTALRSSTHDSSRVFNAAVEICDTANPPTSARLWTAFSVNGTGTLAQVKPGVLKMNLWALLSTFIGLLAFLMLSQQHRSTEGVVSENVCLSFESCECSVTGFFATNENYFSVVDIETDGHASVLSQIFFNSSKWA